MLMLVLMLLGGCCNERESGHVEGEQGAAP